MHTHTYAHTNVCARRGLEKLQLELPLHLRNSYVVERVMRQSLFSTTLKVYAYDSGEHMIKWNFAGVYYLKVIKPLTTDGFRSSSHEFTSKLDQELKFTMLLNKEKRILTLYHTVMAPDLTTFSMVFGHKGGYTLRELLAMRGTSFEQAEVVQAASDVLDGLSVIHRLGAIHRDIGTATILQYPEQHGGKLRYLIFDSEFVVAQDQHGQKLDFAFQAIHSKMRNFTSHGKLTVPQRSVATGLVHSSKDPVSPLASRPASAQTGARSGLEQFKQLIERQESALKDAGMVQWIQEQREAVQKLEFALDGKRTSNIRAPSTLKESNADAAEEDRFWLPENMAPELWPNPNATGAFGIPNCRCDLWSVGVLLFRLTANRLPFTIAASNGREHELGVTADEALDLQAEICNLRNKCPDVLEALDASDTSEARLALQRKVFCDQIMEFLEKDPHNRPESAEMMKEKLIEVHLQTEKASTSHDIFISYRQMSEMKFANMLYKSLNNSQTKKGRVVKVFLDQFDLKDGKEWEKAFAEGLFKSKIYMPILSAGFSGPMAGSNLDPRIKEQAGRRLNIWSRSGVGWFANPILRKLYKVLAALGVDVVLEQDHQVLQHSLLTTKRKSL